MKIVVLDGETLNPGDLSWQSLNELGEFACFPRTSGADIVARAQGAEVILTNKTPLTAKTLAQLPSLKYIGVLATGTNVVDIAAAKAQGIVVTNVPAYAPDAVAQMVFAHILHHTQAVAAHHQAVVDGQWVNCESVEVLSPLGVLATYINPPLSAENGANGEGNSAAACKPHYG